MGREHTPSSVRTGIACTAIPPPGMKRTADYLEMFKGWLRLEPLAVIRVPVLAACLRRPGELSTSAAEAHRLSAYFIPYKQNISNR